MPTLYIYMGPIQAKYFRCKFLNLCVGWWGGGVAQLVIAIFSLISLSPLLYFEYFYHYSICLACIFLLNMQRLIFVTSKYVRVMCWRDILARMFPLKTPPMHVHVHVCTCPLHVRYTMFYYISFNKLNTHRALCGQIRNIHIRKKLGT